jgi:hypothetical protein
MSTYQSLWLAACTVLAFCGAVGAATLSLGGAVTLGVCSGAMVGWIYAEVRARSEHLRPHWRRVSVTAAAAGGLAIAAVGLNALLGGWGFLLLMFLAAGSPPSFRWADRNIFRRLEGVEVVTWVGGIDSGQPGGASMAWSATLAPSTQTALPACSSLTDEELCRGWRHSFLLLATADGATRRRVVQLRRRYLDELERRNPAGFARWLDSGARAAGDPSRYLVDHGPGGSGSPEGREGATHDPEPGHPE